VPVLVMHGDDDQIVPYADSGPLSAKLVKNGTLKTYKASRTACRPPSRHDQRRPAGVPEILIPDSPPVLRGEDRLQVVWLP
jgi:hypothetical protein